MKHRIARTSYISLFLSLSLSCGPKEEEPILDMGVVLQDMSSPEEDMPATEDMPRLIDTAPDSTPEVDMPPDMPEVAQCEVDGMSYDADSEFCREGVLYACTPTRQVISREVTCEPVEVDVQIRSMSAEFSDLTGVPTVSTTTIIANLGTGVAVDARCEERFPGKNGRGTWALVRIPQEQLDTQESFKFSTSYSVLVGDTPQKESYEVRCFASNEGELAATLGNEKSIEFTY